MKEEEKLDLANRKDEDLYLKEGFHKQEQFESVSEYARLYKAYKFVKSDHNG